MTVDVLLTDYAATPPNTEGRQAVLTVGRPVRAMAVIGDWNKDVPYLHSVYVHKKHRRRGIARALVRQAIAMARKAGKRGRSSCGLKRRTATPRPCTPTRVSSSSATTTP